MMNPSEETTWASMSHWLGILIGFLGPLIIMLVKGDQSPRVKAAAVESLNFQITLMIGYFAAFVLSFVIIGVFLFPVLFILQILFPILGALSENKGIPYRYPFALRLVK
ncbi:MAG TPA: DUF4870 domain-containing protein [Propionibacteriaceae bacterium]|nr:DUF4870 domain-containing protein [Micropruina sp.]HBX82194.1 DUF4870 domain-containing protein [Propionibacteriaceae bacterium]HBY22390.1 DUF4870 domain-containing protein [Propionibacteriaceae bacterium]